ncbi:hypothetical protein Hanom_Chr12g01175541 [Helianthus anomalus]
MALTWATGVRFGRMTRPTAVWVVVRAEKRLFLLVICILCFWDYFGHFVLGRVFGPLSFLGPF